MSGGRFQRGNAAARGRRTPVRTTPALIARIDEKLRENGESRETLDFVAEAAVRIIQASTKGDLEACRWLVERFFPIERDIFVTRGRLPSPTKRPAEYLDALVRAVGRGELSTAQAARMANIVKADDLIAELVEALEELAARKTQLQVVK